MKLFPTIVQDQITSRVYMLGYSNDESFKLTKKTGYVWFWSRKRKKLWKKGEISGNYLSVKEIYEDCDADTLLIKVRLVGKNVCHTGSLTCFNKKI